jgi:hypothetical protein
MRRHAKAALLLSSVLILGACAATADESRPAATPQLEKSAGSADATAPDAATQDAFVCGVGVGTIRLSDEILARYMAQQIPDAEVSKHVGLIRSQLSSFTTWTGASEIAERFRHLAQAASNLTGLDEGPTQVQGVEWREVTGSLAEACSDASYPFGQPGVGG